MQKLTAVLLLPLLALAEERIDSDANWRIRREASEHSRVMHTLHILADRYGPRLTGSPNHEAAAKWAIAQLTEWGLKNAHLEPWDFGHPGWQNERASGFVTTPFQDTLTFEVLTWTSSTNGAMTGQAAVLRAAIAPFEEGVAGAASSDSGNPGGRDSTSVNAAGLAGIGLGHTNLDTYERVIPDGAVKASTVIASAIWHLGNRDAMLPRFTKEQMPKPPKPGENP